MQRTCINSDSFPYVRMDCLKEYVTEVNDILDPELCRWEYPRPLTREGKIVYY